MSIQEKRTLVSVITSVLILGLYSFVVFTRYQDQILNNPNDFGFWGAAFLILIPVSIAAQIIIHIFFAIVMKIATGEDLPAISDERDKLIELKTTRISHWIFILGFLLAMGSQVIDMQPWVMFITLISAGFVSSVVAEIAKIYLYRKGV